MDVIILEIHLIPPGFFMKKTIIPFASLFKMGLVLLILLGFGKTSYGQDKFKITGTITDSSNGETVIGAAVLVQDLKATGTATNEYGFYSITLPKGSYTFVVNYLGFSPVTIKIELDKNIRRDFSLTSQAKVLNEVTITGTKQNESVTQSVPGLVKLNVKEVSKIPVIFGEKDLLKTIQLLPGIKSAGEGNNGFYVRGGGSDQNLILLDEAPVYNATHRLGFFSTFNSDVIKDVAIYKGNGPAQFGGRLSSVLDIKMNDGNNQRFADSGGLGLISSKLNIEGPIKKDKSSFIISARRTYVDLFLKLSPDKATRENKLYFYDLNLKANYVLDDKNRL